MRLGVLLAIAALATMQAAQNPVRLDTKVVGQGVSYTIANLTPYKITQVEIYTQFASAGFEHLGCGVTAKVNSTEDLVVRNACRLPLDPKTGMPIKYSSRIVQVRFENGLTWNPDKSPN